MTVNSSVVLSLVAIIFSLVAIAANILMDREKEGRQE